MAKFEAKFGAKFGPKFAPKFAPKFEPTVMEVGAISVWKGRVTAGKFLKAMPLRRGRPDDGSALRFRFTSLPST